MIQWKFEEVLVSELKPFPGNPRDIPEANFAGLFASVARFGLVEPIIWNKKTGYVLGGNQRLRIVQESGAEKIFVVVVDIPLEDELVVNLSLNNPETEGDWADGASEFVQGIDDAMPDLFEALRFDALVEHIESEEEDPVHSSEDSGTGKTSGTKENDIECPCCGYEWKLKSSDVAIEELEVEDE